MDEEDVLMEIKYAYWLAEGDKLEVRSDEQHGRRRKSL
jgi:hypothetical protein